MITLVSADDSDYQHWQLELLAWTWNRIQQPGSLVYLISTQKKELPDFGPQVRVIPSRLLSTHPVSKDHYPPYNKPAAICDYLSCKESSPEIYLLLDPDMVFIRSWNPLISQERPVGENTAYMDPDSPTGRQVIRRHCRRYPEKVQPVGYPVAISELALREIADRWYILTEQMRSDPQTVSLAGWVCEMWAFSVASVEAGVSYSVERNCSFLHDPDQNYPLIHYTYDLMTASGYYWGKRNYRPWDPLPPVKRQDLPGAGFVFQRLFLRYLEERHHESSRL